MTRGPLRQWGHQCCNRNKSPRGYFWIYLAVALLMAIGGIIIEVFQIGGNYKVFWLEAFEITWFALFWIVQTVENWTMKSSPRSSWSSRFGESQTLTRRKPVGLTVQLKSVHRESGELHSASGV